MNWIRRHYSLVVEHTAEDFVNTMVKKLFRLQQAKEDGEEGE